MDISSLISARDYTAPPTPVPLPDAPLSIWPRLAVCPVVKAPPGPSIAQLRVIHDFEFVMLVRGKGWIWWEPLNASIDLVPGDIVFFPPNIHHAWAADTNTHLALHFDLHANPAVQDMNTIHKFPARVRRAPTNAVPCFTLTLAGDTLTIPLVIQAHDPDQWRARLMPFVERYHARTLQSGISRLMAAETVAWGLRTLAHDAASLLNLPAIDPRIARTLPLAQSARPPSVAHLARVAGMGPTAFRHAFTRATGHSPRDYIEHHRLARAKQLLLETHRPIHHIAQACGYIDPYHFSRVFKRVTHESPRQFRLARQT
jgi:AraC-like DNA-binding protein